MCKLLFFLSLLFFMIYNTHSQNLDPKELEEIQRCAFNTGDSRDRANELRRNRNCMAFGNGTISTLRYCDHDVNLCKTRSERKYRPTDTTESPLEQYEHCANGFHPGEGTHNGNTAQINRVPGRTSTSGRCFSLAARGCSISTELEPFVACIDGKSLSSGSCPTKTEDPPSTTTTTVTIGQECGVDDADSKKKVCGYNLFCNEFRVCEKASERDGPCETDSHCLNGLTCVNRRCRALYSIPEGEPCEEDAHSSCSTGYCSDALICSRTYTQSSCRKDADCNNDDNLTNNRLAVTKSVCFISGEWKFRREGKCSAVYHPAARRLAECIADKCSAAEGESSYKSACKLEKENDGGLSSNHPCQKEYARKMCAESCVLPKDRRYKLNIDYTFDCTYTKESASALTACEVTEQFSNCETVMKYPNHASIQKVPMGLIFGLTALLSLLFQLEWL